MPVMNYRKGTEKEKSWIIEETSFNEKYTGKCESVFTQGNGYLGLRNSLEEQYVNTVRGMFITGTFNKASKDEVTELPNVSDIVNMEIELNGERFSMNENNIKEYSRTLNLYTGETCRNVLWKGKNGDIVHLSFHRFVSYENVHVIGAYVEIKPVNCEMKVKVVSGIDAQVTNHGAQHLTEFSKRAFEEKFLQMGMVTTESAVSIAVSTVHKVFQSGKYTEDAASKIIDDRRKIHTEIQLVIPQGETARVEKISTVHSSRDLEYVASGKEPEGENVCRDGLDNLKEAEEKGYETLLEGSKKVWEKIWKKQDIQIDSKEDDAQIAVRFALYHLQIMVRSEDNRVGIGAKALSGEGYKGHSFWDTETFIFPYFQMAEPKTARTLLEFRYKGLYGARKKAIENGYKGAMYPWEAAWVSDGEVTPYVTGVNVHTGEPMICLTGVIEQHITSDIIFALWQYYAATDDQDFMDRYGYEMTIETARFWNSRLEWIEENNRYEIRDVIGPDEYHERVNNNGYTNRMAKYTFEKALEILKNINDLSEGERNKINSLYDVNKLIEQFEDAAENIFIPKPDRNGIIPQFDGYLKLEDTTIDVVKSRLLDPKEYWGGAYGVASQTQIIKQADVVTWISLFSNEIDSEIQKKNLNYYEPRTEHGSSLSACMYSLLYCKCGIPDKAYPFFMKSASADIAPGGKEWAGLVYIGGTHPAAAGGAYMVAIKGFGGLQFNGDEISINPKLPKGWKKLSYKIKYRNKIYQIDITEEKSEIKEIK